MTSQYRRVEPARIDQRAAVRHPVLLQRVVKRRRAGEPIEVRLSDLSIYGCRLEIEDQFSKGERMWLCLRGNEPIGATAIWCENGMLGCRFDTALDRGLFRELVLLSG